MHMKNKKMNIESYDQKIMKLEHEDNADNKLTWRRQFKWSNQTLMNMI